MEITQHRKRIKVSHLLDDKSWMGKSVWVCGWVRTFRNNQFITLNDGSTIENLQAVIDLGAYDDLLLKQITTGCSVSVHGTVVASIGRGQLIELKVSQIDILGAADPETYPLQSKKHSLEFLREKAHLRFRTTTFNAIFRIRHVLALAIHNFFNDRGFIYLNTPIITGSDAEGAGETFKVSSLDFDHLPRLENGRVDFSQDFFGKATNLTVSGQLEGELGAMALGDVYTFGPTFRAENSNTTRHLSEFWMIEPEMAFYDLNETMDLAESLLKHVIAAALSQCKNELAFLEERLSDEEKSKPQQDRSEMSLISKLNFCLDNAFERLSYTDAIELLKSAKPNKSKKFKYIITDWGADLQSEHERYLVEKHFKRPVIITDYPKKIKAFYMRQNEDDRTVRAMDILFPGIGEIIGGSQREERLEKLTQRMDEMRIPVQEMSWYLDTRRYGSAIHSGFGLGFERLVLFVTGMGNIRDVIPFPRSPKSAEF